MNSNRGNNRGSTMRGASRGGASRGRGSSSRGGSSRGRGGSMIDFTSVQMDYESVNTNNNNKTMNNAVSQYPSTSTSTSSTTASTHRRPQRQSNHAHIHNTGIGTSHRGSSFSPSRFMSSYSSDSDSKPIDLLKPVTFVKASSRLTSTIDGRTDSVDHEDGSSREAEAPPPVANATTAIPSTSSSQSESQMDTAAHFRSNTAHDPSSNPTNLQSIESQADKEVESGSRDTLPLPVDIPLEPLQFIVDLVGALPAQDTVTARHLPTSLPVQARASPDIPASDAMELEIQDDESSDTEELYPPSSRSLPTHWDTLASKDTSKSRPQSSQSPQRSSRSYAIVLEDPIHTILAPVIPAQATLDADSIATLRGLTSTSQDPFKPSKKAQKKRERQAARERKRERKRGHTKPLAYRDDDDDDDDDDQSEQLPDSEEVNFGEPTVAIQRPRFANSEARKGPGRRRKDAKLEEVLQDYISNLKQGSLDSEAEDDSALFDTSAGASFLRSTKGEHLNADDLEDIATFREELTSDSNASGIENDDKDGFITDNVSIPDEMVSDGSEDIDDLASTAEHGVTASKVVNGVVFQDASSSDSSEDGDGDDSDDTDEAEAAEEDYVHSLVRQLARSGKKSSMHSSTAFDFDDLDESLQKQWENDRAKKALKRQERYLKRLEAQPSKANRKKAKRAGAPDVAIEGDTLPDFHQLDRRVRTFIDDSEHGELHLPPMDKKTRYAVHMLANAYCLKSKSRGNGTTRHNVLYRTMQTTTRGADVRKVHKYLSVTATWSARGPRSRIVSDSNVKKPNRPGSTPRNAEGTLVGEGANRIAEDNIGHRMLASMGWAAGQQIGNGGGLAEPLSAVVKTGRSGLGSGYIRYNRGVVLASTDFSPVTEGV